MTGVLWRPVFTLSLLNDPPLPRLVLDNTNGCLWDNHRRNLRWATIVQNNRNTGKRTGGPYKGVQPDKRRTTWCARITIGGKVHHVASAPTAELAVRTYDVAARIAFGNYTRTNQELGLLPPCTSGERLPHLDRFLEREQLLGAFPRDRGSYRT